MIGQHPTLYACAELECFTGDTLASCFTYSERVPIVTLHGLLRTVAQLRTGEQTNASVMDARQWLQARAHWSGGQLVSWIEAQVEPRQLIEKSPIHMLRWPSLQRLAEVCAEQPAIHLTRHPLSAVRSLMAAYNHSGETLSPTQALSCWLQGHRNCLRYSAELASTPTLQLRCEDLLHEPEAALQQVCLHLGIDTNSASIASMLHPERSPYACLGPNLAPTGNDPNWMRSPVLRRYTTKSPKPSLWQLWDLDGVPPDLLMSAMQIGWELGYS